MNADGSGQRSLTRNPANDADPAWSPNGRKLAFVSNRDGRYGVYIMNADGSGQRSVAQRSPEAPLVARRRRPDGVVDPVRCGAWIARRPRVVAVVAMRKAVQAGSLRRRL